MAARKFTIPQAVDALFKNHGNVSAAARVLGVDHSTLFNRLKKNEKLRVARAEAEEQLLDLAESTIATLIKEKNVTATIFTLKCKGKKRGWIDTGKPAEDETAKPGGITFVEIDGRVKK